MFFSVKIILNVVLSSRLYATETLSKLYWHFVLLVHWHIDYYWHICDEIKSSHNIGPPIYQSDSICECMYVLLYVCTVQSCNRASCKHSYQRFELTRVAVFNRAVEHSYCWTDTLTLWWIAVHAWTLTAWQQLILYAALWAVRTHMKSLSAFLTAVWNMHTLTWWNALDISNRIISDLPPLFGCLLVKYMPEIEYCEADSIDRE